MLRCSDAQCNWATDEKANRKTKIRWTVQNSCRYEVDYSPGLVRSFSSNSSSLSRTLLVALELEDKQFS